MKRPISWILFFFFFKSGVIFPQTPLWQWVNGVGTSGNEMAWDICADKSSGNVYSCGTFDGNLSGVLGGLFGASGPRDGYVIKYDPNGSILFAFRIGGNGTDEITGITTDASGNFYITGFFEGTVDFDPALFSAANLSSVSGSRDGFIAKFSSTGTFQWVTRFGNSGLDEGVKIFADQSSLYVTGSCESAAVFYSTNSTTLSTAATQSLSNFCGAKYDQSGVVQWVVSAGGNGPDVGMNVKADNNQVYFIGNYFSDLVVYNASGVSSATVAAQTSNRSNVMVLAYSQAGAFSWATNACSADEDLGYGMALDSVNLIICGAYKTNSLSLPYPSPVFTASNAGGFDIFLAAITKTTGVYNWLSPSTGSGSGDEIATALERTVAGDLVMAGSFDSNLSYVLFGGPAIVSSSGNEDVFVTAFNPAGNFLWVTKGGGGNVDIPHGLTSGTSAAIYVAGEYATNAAFTTITLLNFAGQNVFVGKTGCESVANNTIAGTQTVCTGNSPGTFTGSLPSGGAGTFSYQWQRSSNNLTWTPAPGTNTSVNFSAPTSTVQVYYRRVLTSGVSCMYPSNTLTITVNNLPDAAAAGPPQTVCSSSAIIAGNSPLTGTPSWSVLSGPAVVVSPNTYSTAVTSLSVGMNRFVYTISNGVCPPSASTVTITRDALPSPSNPGISQTVCASAATLAASVPTVGTGVWQVLSGGSSVTAASNPSSAVTGLSVGVNIFAWTVANGVCPASSATVAISRDALPATAVAGSNQSVCALAATITAAVPSVGVGSWSLIAGPASIATPLSATTSVSNLGVGQNVFQWNVVNGVCPSSTATVAVYRDALPTAAVAGAGQTICAASATLSGNSPAVGTGSWLVLSGGGSITGSANPTTIVNGLGTGMNAFEWRIANGVCPPSSATVTVMRDALPGVADAGASQTVCSLTATLSAIAPTAGIGTWSVLTGMATVNNLTLASAQIGNLSPGTNILQWTIINGVCPSSSATVAVQRDELPSAALAGTNLVVCSTTATLSATSPLVGSGMWSVLSGPATVSLANNPSTPVSNLSVGDNIFLWSVSNGVCPSSTDTVTVTRHQLPDQATAGPDLSVCGPTAALNANAPAIGAGSWISLTAGSALTQPNSHITTVTGLAPGKNVLVWKISNGVCPSSEDSLIVNSDEFPSPAMAGEDQHVCERTVTLSAITPSIGAPSWLVLSGGGIISNPLQAQTPAYNLSTGENIFILSLLNGVCPPSQDSITVYVDENPSVAAARPDATVCGAAQDLFASVPAVGAGVWSGASTSGAIASPLSASTQVTGLTEGEQRFVWTVRNGVCPSSADTVLLVVNLAPDAPFAGRDQTVCTANVTLEGVPPARGAALWSLVHGAAVVQNADDASSAVSIASDSLVLRWTVTHGVCPAVSDEVKIRLDTVLPRAFAGQDIETENMEVNLAATADKQFTGEWLVLQGGGTIEDFRDASTKVRNLSTGVNRFRWQVKKDNCPVVWDEVTVFLKEFNIPNAFSPNDDGFNDVFHVDALENYENVRLQIYNRWGTLLFTEGEYRNDWKGTNSRGEQLIDDTYFYVLEVPGRGNFTGFVIIKKNR